MHLCLLFPGAVVQGANMMYMYMPLGEVVYKAAMNSDTVFHKKFLQKEKCAKQGRDDIIVKVNLQSLILSSLSH